MNKKIVLVCSGSGVHFPAYFGAIEAFLDHQLEPSIIGGASGGALATGLYTCALARCGDPLAAMALIKKTISKIKLNKLIRFWPFDLLYGFLYSRANLGLFLDEFTGNMRFGAEIKDDFPFQVDLKIIATDVATSKIKVFSSKTTPNLRISDAMMASSALPLAFEPLYIENSYFVDGGVAQDVPYEEFVHDTAVGKYVLFPQSGALGTRLSVRPSRFDVLKRSLDVYIASSEKYQKQLALDHQFEVVDLDTSFVSSVDFSVSSEVLLKLWAVGYSKIDSLLSVK